MNISSTLSWVIISCIALLAIGIVKNSIQIVQGQKRLSEAVAKVEALQQQKSGLIQENQRRESPEYLDKQIRDKLKLVKPGETMVLIPGALKDKPQGESYTFKVDEKKNNQAVPVWKEWVAVFW